MSNRLPYSYLQKEVDKLYSKEFDDNDLKGIEAHCDFIAAYIRACGWSEEQYALVMMGNSLEDMDKNKKAN